MKKMIFCVISIVTMTMHAQYDASSERRWLILATNNDQHPQLIKQLQAINEKEEAAIERKIGIAMLSNGNLSPLFNASVPLDRLLNNQNLTIDEKLDFEAILIGLDGSVKWRKKQAIALDELFQLIDSMPMRQREMRQQKNKNE